MKNLKIEIKEKIFLTNALEAGLMMSKENTQSIFRSFNPLNKGNPQNKHTQEVWCKYHKSNKHSSAYCKNKIVNQNNSSSKNDHNINNNNNNSNSSNSPKIRILPKITQWMILI